MKQQEATGTLHYAVKESRQLLEKLIWRREPSGHKRQVQRQGRVSVNIAEI